MKTENNLGGMTPTRKVKLIHRGSCWKIRASHLPVDLSYKPFVLIFSAGTIDFLYTRRIKKYASGRHARISLFSSKKSAEKFLEENEMFLKALFEHCDKTGWNYLFEFRINVLAWNLKRISFFDLFVIMGIQKKSVLKKEEMWLLNFLKENLIKEKKSQSIS